MRRQFFTALFFLTAYASFSCVLQAAESKASSIILVDDFNQAFSANHLGGSYGLVAEGGEAGFDFVQPPVPYLANDSALRIRYEFKSSPGYAFLWMKLGKHKESVEQTEYLDLSNAVFLSFKYKASPDVPFKVELHEDLDQNSRFDFSKDRTSFVYTDTVKKFNLDGGWVKVLIPLKRFSGIKDWTKILELVFVLEKDRSGKSGEILLDDLLFIRKELKKGNGSAAEPDAELIKEVQVLLNGQPASSGMTLQGKNHFVVSYQPAKDFEEMESLTLQLRADGKESWVPVATAFDPGKTQTEFFWEAFTFEPPDAAALRLVAYDFLGRSRIIAGPFEKLTVPALTNEQFLDLVEYKAFLYFRDTQNLQNGLFYDTTGGGDLSIGVTGFGLSALVIGAERGWMDKKEARDRARLCLESFLTKIEDKEGFYYHFLNPHTLKRAGTSEVSTVDTALLLAGAITAGEYFGGDIKKKAKKLYQKANWDFYLDKNQDEEHYLQFHHGWTPEEQLVDNYWDYYTDETLLLDLLGIGAPKHAVPADIFYHFVRRRGQYKERPPFIFTWHGGLFSYQYANAWYDFRGRVDREGINWYENSKEATLSNRAFAIDHATEYKTYGPDSWGITSMRVPEGYIMHYGPLPNGQNRAEHDGTIAPSGPAGSIELTPYASLRALKNLYLRHPDLWGVYGFKDSLNKDRNWISPVYYGLGEGIMLLSIENFRTGLVWRYFGKNKNVKKGLSKSGFQKNKKKPLLEPFRDLTVREPNTKDPNELLRLGKEQSQLLESLEVNDLERGRLYLIHAEEDKNKALEFFEEALKGPLSETGRLEVYQEKIALLQRTLSLAALDQTREQLAAELKRGVKNHSYNLAWVLKWAEPLDDETASRIRSEFYQNLKKRERKVLFESIKTKAEEAFSRGDYQKAAALSEEQVRFMEKEKNKKPLVHFLEKTAKSFAEVQKYVEAERFYRLVIEKYGAPGAREKNSFELAKMLETKGDKERAIQEYQNLIDNFPKGGQVPEALSRVANIESSLGHQDKTIRLLQQIMTHYAATSYAQEANYLLGMVYFHAKRYTEAIQTWEEFLKKFPDSPRVAIVQDYLEKADRKVSESGKA